MHMQPSASDVWSAHSNLCGTGKPSIAAASPTSAGTNTLTDLSLNCCMHPAARLLSHPAPRGFNPVQDLNDNYQFLYPFGWQEVTITGADVVYKDVVEPLESVSVTITPTDKKDVTEFGDIADVSASRGAGSGVAGRVQGLLAAVAATAGAMRGLKTQLATMWVCPSMRMCGRSRHCPQRIGRSKSH